MVKDKIHFPGSTEYTASLGSYFSLQEANVHPLFIVSPKTAQDVSKAVRVLAPDSRASLGCHFAIRSGGHASFRGAANIEGGTTIDLRALDSIALGPGMRPNTVSVGAGATWGDAYSYLDILHLRVNGGRGYGIGVGGVTVGGGISYFGPRFGWTCDTVDNFEIVLANGSIINAKKSTEYADLQWALRGGTNNFGVITRIDLQTFEQGDLWGGEVIRPTSTVNKAIAALAAFNDPAMYDEFSSLITTFGYSGAENVSFV